MDIINHSIWAYIVSKLLKVKKTWLIILFVFTGALPDIIGFIGTYFYGNWELYLWAHTLTNPFNLFPGYLLHILMDYNLHGTIVWYKGWGIIYWVTSWLLAIVIIWRIKKCTMKK
ncbi:MAG: hypothetical protein KKB34_10175 [Bacteroidetes bacterium]|nr:hypothetical protein [Bacteroidota bacterium]